MHVTVVYVRFFRSHLECYWWTDTSVIFFLIKHCMKILYRFRLSHSLTHSLILTLSLFFRLLGADAEFLVRLWLFHRYDIHIGYHCTATYWLSGTRSCGKYFSIHSQLFVCLFLWFFLFNKCFCSWLLTYWIFISKKIQCTLNMVKWTDVAAATTTLQLCNLMYIFETLFNHHHHLTHFLLPLYGFLAPQKLINWKRNQDEFSGTNYGKTRNS